MSSVKSVAVFCGSKPGRKAVYMKEAHHLGEILARHDISLIYGAGTTGLMGAVAEGVFSEEGSVVGATIKSLYDIEKPQEIAMRAEKFEVFGRMSERKVAMVDQSDAICILPGGYGTLDELFEVLTLRQLGVKNFPIVLVNIGGFFSTLHQFLFEMVGEGFVQPYQLKLIGIVNSVEEVLPEIERQLAEIEEGIV